MSRPAFYGEDLSHIHHVGFGSFATRAAPGLLSLLRAAQIHGGRVVDLGCGSGLWAAALVDAGYEVLGVDVSPEMITLASSVAPAAHFIQASLHAVELPPCAAVTAIGEGLTYLTPEDPLPLLPRLFERVYDALSPGGLLLFDVVIRSTGRPMRYTAERSGEGWRVVVDVEETPDASMLTRHVRTERWVDGAFRQSEEVHRVRTFSRQDLEETLRSRGFTVRVHRRYGALLLPPGRLAFRARTPPTSRK